ncbi:ABC transporter ATP-binding protein [Nakamurella lactea]|uniref:ABC transporter ATP-binding protein n=1 Tax=Nakamurella lactea TaxID=459515 RepID=UPI00048FD3F4|nr:ABC transporter ATP-binding protein [Nakamurella lactea]
MSGHAVREQGQSLRLAGLSVGYRKRPVLQPVTESAEPGRVTVLLGPNGSGKSTLLRTVAGLQPPLAGQIHLGDDDLLAMDPRARARQLAVVLTDRFEVGLLRGGDVVALGRHPYLGMGGSLRPADRAAVAAALAAVHAEELADRLLAEMSDGQRQRILIARALAQEPRLLLLDEPSAFLDAPSRIELLAVLRRIAEQRGIPILVSTHDVEAAIRAGQDGWVIDQGRMRSGTVEMLARTVIGDAFDTPAVRFDAADSTFRLR